MIAARPRRACQVRGLIHSLAGLAIGIAPPFRGAWRRRHIWYTLTDRRAFVVSDVPLRGRKLKSDPIEPSTAIDDTPGQSASIPFGLDFRRSSNGWQRTPIGFERIHDGNEVCRLFRDVQRGNHAA